MKRAMGSHKGLIAGKQLIDLMKNKCEQFHEKLLGKEVAIIEFEAIPNYAPARLQVARISANEKAKFFLNLGLNVKRIWLAANTTRKEFSDLISLLNDDFLTISIVVQMPIPEDFLPVLEDIYDEKDIDGLKNSNKLFSSYAVVESVIRLLNPFIKSSMKVAVVGGNGNIGTRIIKELTSRNIKYIVVDVDDSLDLVTDADIIVTAVGKPFLLTEQHLYVEHELVVDVGFAPIVVDGEECFLGDVSPSAYSLPKMITPVPGGVGPIQIATLAERILWIVSNGAISYWSFSPNEPRFLL